MTGRVSLALAVGVAALLAFAGAVQATVVVIDNVDPEVSLEGSWSTSAWSSDRIGANYLHSNRQAGLAATYTPSLTAGQWKVEAFWNSSADRGNDVPYTIIYDGGSTTEYRDQRADGGQWNDLGTYPFADGTAGSVTISSNVSNSDYVVADAIRFIDMTSVEPGVPPLPATAYASTSHPENPDRMPENVVNGSGMTDTDGDGIPETHAANAWGDNINWMTDDVPSDDPDPWIALDFSEVVPLGEMKVWNFNAESGRTNRGVGLADIYVSTRDDVGIHNEVGDDPDFSDNAVWTLLKQAQAFSEAPGDSGYNIPDELDLGGIEARWLALDITENLGGAFVGLSEIQVFEDRIPEPATVGLLALGALGLLRRRIH